jgi:hypothetical protein
MRSFLAVGPADSTDLSSSSVPGETREHRGLARRRKPTEAKKPARGDRDFSLFWKPPAVPERRILRALQFTGKNFTQTGFGTSTTCPVGVSLPLFGSMRKATTLSDSWLAASRKLPLGSMPKLRGTLPCVD